MKPLFTFLIVLISHSLFAQCPYISGVLADAIATGTPTAGEGKNEFLAFNTGSSSVAVNTLYFSYSTTTTSTNFAIDGTITSPASVWTSLVTPSLITNSSGTITVVTSGSIPANKHVVVIASTNEVSYDLKTFGTDVYVLPYNAAAGSPRVVGFAAAGNYANSGGTARYLRIRQGATCRDTVSYIPSSLPGADGGGAKWNSAGTITYSNTGGSGAVLPINLTHFSGNLSHGYSTLQWRTSGNSTAQSFEIEKSIDGNEYSKIGTLSAQKESSIAEKSYEYTYQNFGSQNSFYRLRTIDVDGTANYSPTLKLNGGKDEILVNSSVYPNPFTNELHLKVSSTNGFSEMQLLDFMGKKHLQQTLQAGENIINVAKLPAGFYFVHLKSAAKTETFKVWKN